MKTQRLEMTQYSNGKFAICPKCGTTMAHNVCGYWTCLFGCGYETKSSKRCGLTANNK